MESIFTDKDIDECLNWLHKNMYDTQVQLSSQEIKAHTFMILTILKEIRHYVDTPKGE